MKQVMQLSAPVHPRKRCLVCRLHISLAKCRFRGTAPDTRGYLVDFYTCGNQIVSDAGFAPLNFMAGIKEQYLPYMGPARLKALQLSREVARLTHNI